MSDIASAFQSSANVSPAQLSLVVRTIIYALIMIWAGMTIYGHYQNYKEKKIDIVDIPMRIFRVLSLCSIALILVYVS